MFRMTTRLGLCHSEERSDEESQKKRIIKVGKTYYVYLLTNKGNSVLYAGVTNNLERRIYEHKNKLIDGFTKKYNLGKLVYYESTTEVQSAIAREKQIKGWTRKRKNDLIEGINPEWKDLSEEWDSSLRSE